MACSRCGQKHFKKHSVLKVIHAIEPWKLVHDYTSVMAEIGASMRNDAANNRKGAFIARLRDYKECYLKGLWVGLMATPEEIVHDASGEKPRLTLTKLVKRVGKTVFDDQSKVSASSLTQRKTKFEAMDILTTSMRLTPLFLLHWGLMSDLEAKRMYDGILKNMQTETAQLKYVSGALKAAKRKQDILGSLRQLVKNKRLVDKRKSR
jgi:hypothetical protein